jgi:hypothetical protein
MAKVTSSFRRIAPGYLFIPKVDRRSPLIGGFARLAGCVLPRSWM